jgi:hypothetical protein
VDFRKLILAAGLLAAAVPAAAAPTVPNRNANGQALILVPLTLTKIDDLSFGTIVPSALSGVVVIDATTGGRTIVGGVAGVASDVGNRAYFAGGGSPSQLVVVSLTQPGQLTSLAGDTIPVLALTLQGSPIKLIDPVTRTFFFGVGGIILVNANQPEGVYDATFTVTANYQ